MGVLSVNTLFRIAFYLTILFMLFNLGWGFIRGIDDTIFAEGTEQNHIGNTTDTSVFNELTGLDNAGLSIWAMLMGIGGVVTGLVSWAIQNLTPFALYIFGSGFWTSYNATVTAVNLNNWIPGDFMLMITVVVLFIFVGAVIGLITGNG
jgi:hypothetical protein